MALPLALLVSWPSGLTACGGAAEPAAGPAPARREASSAKPPDAPTSETSAAEEPEALEIPTACAEPPADAKANCLPPPAFAKRLCGGFHPDVALTLFRKGTPWTRAYLSRNTDAWNASGGASSNERLEFDEEVLILTERRADTGGMVVSGAGGGYDVLRWDGTCASLMVEELRKNLPPRPKYAKIPWRSLGMPVRDALMADPKVEGAYSTRRKECKGVTLGAVSKACEVADAKLGTVIVDYVRQGGALPAPDPLR